MCSTETAGRCSKFTMAMSRFCRSRPMAVSTRVRGRLSRMRLADRNLRGWHTATPFGGTRCAQGHMKGLNISPIALERIVEVYKSYSFRVKCSA